MPVWDNTKLVISIEQSGQTTSKNVLNISSEKSFENAEIAYFVENMGEIKLVETPILPNDKSISLGSHHGTKPLEVLCNRLKENPYVVSMQSTDNSRGSSHKFIKNVFPDGKIEIVLFKTDSKYAVIVQTTGKNLRETKKIATILDKKYS